ncbi:DUF1329 domain-containing protein [Ferrimonas sediminicola]|uniref:DUF1329 domain-containing protein n=1 Tax=Ferrimonas sediminicola TaxID=2569538 RepID=A0A4U1BK06_9GAMM|nr:DUF1329 domain-containing protein [Ferrimonas sediminicola]TKB50420.1 DUF1329 domain-containing protein [Ferrimonas sediminicola]
MQVKPLFAAMLALSCSFGALAKVTPEQAKALGDTLTPIGAEKAGNTDGSIPAWSGGITEAPADYKKGEFHTDPYADDKQLYTITADNMGDYAKLLTPGVKKMFEMYPDTYKMKVYPTRRSASYPQFIYDASIANATTAELVAGGNGLKNASIGVPFPIPQNGLEAIWNHILRYRGTDAQILRGQAAPTASGSYTLVKTDEKIKFLYSRPDADAVQLQKDNLLFYFKQVVTSPARLAGTALLVHETMDQEKEPRKAWTYNTGQRRVRRAPNVAFDTPGTASDGMRTTDDFDMYNGSPSRYNWALKGKKEILIPYNNYQLHGADIKYEQILKPGHINMDLVRWEKHRVWEVEATLKEGISHLYKTRTFYLDEDSWQVSLVDLYDKRDQLYRVGMAHAVNYYDLPTLWTTLEVFYDLSSRRYLAMGLDNEDGVASFDEEFSVKTEFTTNALRRSGRR